MTRLHRDGYPDHVYCKGVDGNMIFYSASDCIYYITLYSCLARKHRIRTTAFSLMPNHTHSQQLVSGRKRFIAFNAELLSLFTRGYNSWHRREGPLFESPFGSVPKVGEKYIKNNTSYICNNGPAGRLSKGIIDYRWNLMAYHDSDHPFSERMVPSKASKRMREAKHYVLKLRKENRPIDYRIQEMLFKGLNKKEKLQLTDFIISKYNFLDYSLTVKLFGSFDKGLAGMDANTGSEHDMKEEWEDYSEYRAMMEKAKSYGLDLERVNFETMDKDTLFNLVPVLSSVCFDKKKISRFLHLKNPEPKASAEK